MDDHLIRGVGNAAIVLGPWADDFRCWLSNRADPLSALLVESYPTWPVLGSDMTCTIDVCANLPRDQWDDYLCSQQSLFDTPINPTLYPPWEKVSSSIPTTDPYIAYVNSIPLWARQLAQPFGIFQWVILEGIRYLDGFGDYVSEPHSSITLILSLLITMPVPSTREHRLNRLRAIVNAARA